MEVVVVVVVLVVTDAQVPKGPKPLDEGRLGARHRHAPDTQLLP